MAIGVSVNPNSREYITKNPVRSSIGAIGYGTVQGINLVVDTVDFGRDIIKLAKLSIQESIIEAEVEAKKAQLNGMDELARLEADLLAKQAKLIKPRAKA